MNDLARRKSADRDAVFRRAAADQGLPPLYMEKDFWVCWLLRQIFNPPVVPGMVFKGGTSLSKVWGAIQRFSEDIDLTLPRDKVPGAEELTFDPTASRTKQKRILEALRARLSEWCKGDGLKAIEQKLTATLGTRNGWDLTSDDDSMVFTYPRGLPPDAYEGSYVAHSVKLEFGLLMPVKPRETRVVRPYCHEAGSYRMADPDASVQVLAAERTFWEKATLLHELNNRDVPKRGDRLSRHYADLASLARHDIGKRALDSIGLLEIVAQQKDELFHSGHADYPAAARGQLRLRPPSTHEDAVRQDYTAMREMYFEEPLVFDEILRILEDLEHRVAERFRTVR